MTCAKDKCFKVWQFPPIWVDEQAVDLQRAPDASKVKKAVKARQANGTQAQPAAKYQDDDSSDDDDGLGRIRPEKAGKSSESTLPAGLGQVFNMNNPLAAPKKKQEAA